MPRRCVFPAWSRSPCGRQGTPARVKNHPKESVITMSPARLSFTIPPREGRAFELEKGEKMRVIDSEGKQVADFLAFNARELREHLSTGVTIDNNSSLCLKPATTCIRASTGRCCW